MAWLTYCTNVHPGESWDETAAMLASDAAAVRDAAGRPEPFPLGLRLSGAAAARLTDAAERDRFAGLVADHRFDVRTLNGFPYGAFHGEPVKEQVYGPDWADPLRLSYTLDLAHALAAVLPHGVPGSISTLPVTFKPWATPERLDAAAVHLVDAAVGLERLAREEGADVALAIEPEPCCFLETIEETVAYFEGRLFAGPARAQAAHALGVSEAAAEAVLRSRLGVCYDVCHGAVEFETPSLAMAQLHAAGVRIPKIQLSAAVRAPGLDAPARERLSGLVEPTYLHQVVAKAGETLLRYADLPEALARGSESDGEEWRVHFHVPIFRAEMDGLSTTQDALVDAIKAQVRHGYADHLEVETYTWGVLPPEARAADPAAAIARELAWARETLNAAQLETA